VYGGDASIFSVQQITYTIGPGSEGQPALFRNGVEFIDGIENLQVLYGEDTDGSGVANYYVPANQVVDMGRVISIRFAVVARSYDDNLTAGIAQNFIVLGANAVAGDNRLRQVYTSTVTIRNRL
jgi:type IV pilus assembly protein PilW